MISLLHHSLGEKWSNVIQEKDLIIQLSCEFKRLASTLVSSSYLCTRIFKMHHETNKNNKIMKKSFAYRLMMMVESAIVRNIRPTKKVAKGLKWPLVNIFPERVPVFNFPGIRTMPRFNMMPITTTVVFGHA